jgi:hypothetical protein
MMKVEMRDDKNANALIVVNFDAESNIKSDYREPK